MKLLMISTDKKIFDKDSAVAQRQIEYAKKYEEVHIIIFTKKIKDNKKWKRCEEVDINCGKECIDCGNHCISCGECYIKTEKYGQNPKIRETNKSSS